MKSKTFPEITKMILKDRNVKDVKPILENAYFGYIINNKYKIYIDGLIVNLVNAKDMPKYIYDLANKIVSI